MKEKLTIAYQLAIIRARGKHLSTFCLQSVTGADGSGKPACKDNKRKKDEDRFMQGKLTDAEWKIMTVLWEHSPRTMMEITNALKEETGWTKYTVISFLKRMEEKGALHFEEGKKAKLYYPDWEKDKVCIQETEDFLNKVFHGKIGLMLNAMVQQKALSEQEIDELYQILQEESRNQRSKKL